MPAIVKPLFLVGTGRCGSTIIYSCLAMHREFSWISSWLTIVPRSPGMSVVNRIWDIPGMDRFREARFFPKPVEPNPVFDAWDPTFGSEALPEAGVGQPQPGVLELVQRVVSAHGRPRFLAKMVGRPVKVSLLNALFPDALFLHITRGVKPTTASLLQVEFYHGVDLSAWHWEPIPLAYRAFVEQRGNAAEVKAAVVVRMNLRSLEEQLATVPGKRVMIMQYAAFVADPEESLRRLGQWGEFAVDAKYLTRVRSRRLYAGADEKWRTYFSKQQQQNLDDFEALAAEKG